MRTISPIVSLVTSSAPGSVSGWPPSLSRSISVRTAMPQSYFGSRGGWAKAGSVGAAPAASASVSTSAAVSAVSVMGRASASGVESGCLGIVGVGVDQFPFARPHADDAAPFEEIDAVDVIQLQVRSDTVDIADVAGADQHLADRTVGIGA